MPVFAIFELHLRPGADDEARADYERYRAAVPALVEAHGGRYLARAVGGELLEGAPEPGERWHLIEFPTAEHAHGMWTSPDYLAIRPLREAAVDVRAILIG